MDKKRREELRQRYLAAGHAVQSGVAMKMSHDPSDTTPKHLRVGVDMAMSDQSGLAELLIKKGVITEEEYFEAMCDGAEREKAKYELELSEHLGKKITLG